jgi:uracil-DNA glycosylase
VPPSLKLKSDKRLKNLKVLQAELAACRACPKMIGPVVHGPPVMSRVLLVGQAPGPHEGELGRPFAWTAGKTLFRWFEEAMGTPEAVIRERIYFAAVARCFPGKAKGGGDRVPAPDEIDRCGAYLAREVAILEPELVLPVGSLAIGEVLGEKRPLAEVVGAVRRATYHGRNVDVIALPHPSGASTWHRTEPGKTLLEKALRLVAKHPATRAALGGSIVGRKSLPTSG